MAMSRKLDSWQERYLSVVPEKLTARDASIILDLIQEDTDRFVEALDAFALCYEEDLGSPPPQATDGCGGATGR
jgi:hypothetical protein